MSPCIEAKDDPTNLAPRPSELESQPVIPRSGVVGWWFSFSSGVGGARAARITPHLDSSVKQECFQTNQCSIADTALPSSIIVCQFLTLTRIHFDFGNAPMRTNSIRRVDIFG